MKSLEGQLRLGLTLSLMLLILGGWWLGHAALHHGADALVLTRLQEDAEFLLDHLRIDPDGQARIGAEHFSPHTEQPFSGHYLVVRDTDAILWRSPSLGEFPLPTRTFLPGQHKHWQARGPDGQHLLIWGAGYRRDNADISLNVAEDVRPVERAVRGFERTVALLALFGLAAMLSIQRWILRRAFARLQPVYQDIGRLESGATGQLTEAVPTELLPLVRKINGLLAVYSARLGRSRRAAGNLAHALKAPLAVLLRQLEASPLSARDRDQLRAHVGQLQSQLERELQRARLSGAVSVGAWFDPAAEIGPLIQLLRQIHADKALEIDWRLDARESLPFDREDLLELLGNLLDNACKWAATRVSARLWIAECCLCLRIEDDGTGCADQELNDILARGARLDERAAGHGLGLSIVKDIVDLYRGRLSLGRAPLGGLRVECRLPLSVR